MTQGYNKGRFPSGNAESTNNGNNTNNNNTIDPALLRIQDSTASGAQLPRSSHGRQHGQSRDRQNSHMLTPGLAASVPRSREDMQRPSMISTAINGDRTSQRLYPLSMPGYPDAGLIERAHLAEFDTPASVNSSEGLPRSLRKRNSAAAGLSGDAESSSEDLRSSTRLSKCIKASPECNGTGNGRTRKVSKQEKKIAEGKIPQKGSLGPKGEIRPRDDGRMEFRDTNNPEWTLAAYHKDYRRELLDEAAEDGEFDYLPARGEAPDDETSYEPNQQSWGPSREDWQNIVNAEGGKVMFEVEKPTNRRPPQEPENMVRDGYVLLDSKNHAVKDWPGLNKTLSSEIESWRWEALLRVHPWLTVGDLLARMPHERVKKGEWKPLQTPQAFTNRAYRLRVPNQIPATKPKKGSGTYKASILKNLAKQNAKTTETLSTLSSAQIKKVRKENSGKFVDNSRYVIKSDDHPKSPPASKKRSRSGDDDTQFESEQRVKRPCTQASQSPTVGLGYNVDEDAYGEDANIYDQLTDTAEQWLEVAHENLPTNTMEAFEDQNQEDLVPLFATIDDQGLALVENPDWTTAGAVILARREGNQQTRQIDVYWYSASVPRHVGPDGNIVEDVVDLRFLNMYEVAEPIPGDAQHQNLYDFLPPSEFCDIPSALDPWFEEPIGASSQGFPPQAFNNPQSTASSSSQTPLSAFFPIGRYQTQSDSAEEVWRDQYGPAGF